MSVPPGKAGKAAAAGSRTGGSPGEGPAPISFGWLDLVAHTKVSGFAGRLAEGRLSASRCRSCGAISFPPRADCASCMSEDFELHEIGARARLLSYTRIAAPPIGFEDLAPYRIGLAEFPGAGRVLAWIGSQIPDDRVAIGMDLIVVPRIRDCGAGGVRAYYTLEIAGDPGGSDPLIAGSQVP